VRVLTYAVRSKNLTADVKRIFGDFVEEAFFCDETYNDISGSDADRLIGDADCYEKGSDIDLPTAGAILLRLTNGNKVWIGTSEWGLITSVPDKIIIIERNEKAIDR